MAPMAVRRLETVRGRIALTLDIAGNATSEDVRDSSGALKRTVTRSFDALNRLQQVTIGTVAGRVGSTVTLIETPSRPAPDQSVTLTAQVNGNGPTGTVLFYPVAPPKGADQQDVGGVCRSTADRVERDRELRGPRGEEGWSH